MRRWRWGSSGGSARPTTLMDEARRHAEVLAAKPISSLVAVKRTMTEPRAGRDRGRPRARERRVRRADGRPGQPGGAGGVRRRPGGRLHLAAAGEVSASHTAPARRKSSRESGHRCRCPGTVQDVRSRDLHQRPGLPRVAPARLSSPRCRVLPGLAADHRRPDRTRTSSPWPPFSSPLRTRQCHVGGASGRRAAERQVGATAVPRTSGPDVDAEPYGGPGHGSSPLPTPPHRSPLAGDRARDVDEDPRLRPVRAATEGLRWSRPAQEQHVGRCRSVVRFAVWTEQLQPGDLVTESNASNRRRCHVAATEAAGPVPASLEPLSAGSGVPGGWSRGSRRRGSHPRPGRDADQHAVAGLGGPSRVAHQPNQECPVGFGITPVLLSALRRRGRRR